MCVMQLFAVAFFSLGFVIITIGVWDRLQNWSWCPKINTNATKIWDGPIFEVEVNLTNLTIINGDNMHGFTRKNSPVTQALADTIFECLLRAMKRRQDVPEGNKAFHRSNYKLPSQSEMEVFAMQQEDRAEALRRYSVRKQIAASRKARSMARAPLSRAKKFLASKQRHQYMESFDLCGNW
jgi:hypothetical protein